MSHHLKDISRHCRDRSPIRRSEIDSSEHHSSLNQVCAGRSQDQGSRNQYQGNRNQYQGSRKQYQGNRNQYQEGRNQDQGSKRQDQGSRSQDQGSERQDQGSRNQHQGGRSQDQRSRRQDQGGRSQDQGGRSQDQRSRRQGQGGRSQDQGSRRLDKGSRRQDQGGRSQDSSEYRLCIYCGNDILNNQDESIIDDRGYHGECIRTHIPKCDKAVAAFRETSTANPIVLRIGIDVTFLYGQNQPDKNKKTKRANKITELLKKVSAVRNSDSGCILIHLVGLNPEDNFTGAFDEFADEKLDELIEDGSAFDDVYKKERLSAQEEFKDIHDILVLFVKGAHFLETVDFKTKSALDECIKDTPYQNLLRFVKNEKKFEKKYHAIPVSIPDDLHKLQESRDIQLKAYFEKRHNVETVLSVLSEQRLTEYISAFSKLKNGGSYLLGIAEKGILVPYKSKICIIKPVNINNCEDVEKSIKDYISKEVLVCDYDGKVEADPDLIQVFFIPASDRTSPSADYVIHVSVRPVSGIVFYDKDGPVAYRINPETNSMVRLTFKEWFGIFKQELKQRGNE